LRVADSISTLRTEPLLTPINEIALPGVGSTVVDP
jgi:hypothetical protein